MKWLIFLLLPIAAFSQGICPSGLPVTGTNCYFVSNAGLDTNNGTSESTPWLHSPGMQNCSNNCSSVGIAGHGFIFRGGDTWHFGNPSAVPYAGVVAGCANNGRASGGLCLDNVQASSGSPTYYGADKTWFTGGSWVRPILTADNSPCNSGTIGTLPDGSTCSNGTDPTGRGQATYVVNSCAYQVGTQNVLVDIGFSKYVYLDNFELTGLCGKTVGQVDGVDLYLSAGGGQGPSTITNNYIHGDSHLQYAFANSSTSCTSSVYCFDMYAFNGNVIVGTVGNTYQDNVVDFSDSDPAGTGLCYPGTDFWNFSYNIVRYQSQCIPADVHVLHDNLFEYYYENGHSNLIEDSETSPIGTMYDNLFRHLFGALVLWPGPTGSSDADYFFNNVVYDVTTSQYFDYGGVGLTTNLGSYFVFNNTFQSNGSSSTIIACAASGNTFKNTNNHFIDDTTAYPGSCSGMTNLTAVSMSNSTATSDGYTSSQTYGYSPTESGSPTVGTGTNEYSGYCSTLLASSDSFIQAAGTACRNDTTYSCSYNTSNHAVSCPARTMNTRPISTSWDAGAYEYAAGPSAPSRLSVTVSTYISSGVNLQ